MGRVDGMGWDGLCGFCETWELACAWGFPRKFLDAGW